MKTFTIDPTQFLVETMHLTPWEIGSYVLLMANQAAREKPVQVGHMRTLCRVGPEADLSDVPFVNEGEEWSHPDITAQIAERDRLDEFHKTRAAAGAAARHGGKNGPAQERVRTPKAPVAVQHPQTDNGGSNPPGTATDLPADTFPADDAKIEFESDSAALASLGTMLPPDFAMTGTMISEAKVKGVDDMALLADMFDEFKKYHLNAGTLHPDWYAAWDKWFERKRPKKPRAAPRVQVSNAAKGADD